MIHLRYLCLILILLIAVAMDIKSYKVSNRLIAFSMIFGVCLNMEYARSLLLFNVLAGLVVPMILFPLYRYSMLGAADIKLFAVSGFYIGFLGVIYTMLGTFVLAAAISLYRMIKDSRLRMRFFYFLEFIKQFPTNDKKVYMDFSDKDRAACIHMTVPMSATVALLYMGILIKMWNGGFL